jgi:hypothetical protein
VVVVVDTQTQMVVLVVLAVAVMPMLGILQQGQTAQQILVAVEVDQVVFQEALVQVLPAAKV